jgi:DNA polymerase-3 subunit alpha (Gram-positive type)
MKAPVPVLISKTTIELMSDLGLFGDMPESNQLSLFDFGA